MKNIFGKFIEIYSRTFREKSYIQKRIKLIRGEMLMKFELFISQYCVLLVRDHDIIRSFFVRF